MHIAILINYFLLLECTIWILSLYINNVLHSQRINIRNFIFQFFLFNKVTIRNTFSKKEKEFKIYANRINSIAYILVGITLLAYFIFNILIGK